MDLEQRLARLERGNRRMKRIGTLVLLAAGVVLLSGQAKGKALPDLEVRSLTLKDTDGKARARMDAIADGTVGLVLLDKDGKARAELTVDTDGAPGLALFDKTGTMRTWLSMEADGLPSLFFYDKDEEVRALLGPEVGLALLTGGKVRVTLGVRADSPALMLIDKDKTRASLRVLEDGSPSLDLFDKDEQTRATLGVTTTVHKRTGAKTTTAGTLTLFDAKGDVLWQAPR